MTRLTRVALAACLGAGAVIGEACYGNGGWGMGGAPDKVGEVRYRTVEIERDALATRKAGDDSIPIAISSEEPVARHFGKEILSHSADAVDLSYARDGLPLLDNHDTDRQIGKVRNVRLGADRRLRGELTFGNHPDAGWLRKDIEAGIRGHISVGYRVNSMTLTDTDREAGDSYTVDSWTPMEVSSVPVPADISVGVGRAAEGLQAKGTKTGWGGSMSTSGGSFEDIRKNLEGIYALGSEHGVGPEVVKQAVARGLTRDQFAREILDRKVGEHRQSSAVGVALTEREHSQYNLGRAILAQASGDWRGAGLEREVSQTLAKGAANYQGGLVVPWNTRASVTGNIVATSSLGGAAVATEMRELIELLRNRLTVAQAGARFLPGLQGNISYPRQITANTLNWVGENPASANTPSVATFDNVLLSPKTAMISTAYSRQFLVQSSFDVAGVIADDLSQVCAVGLDYAALNGIGSSNQPTGIRVQSGITNKTLGAAGANLAWADILSLESSVSTANADIGAISFLMTPGTRSKLKSTLQNTTSGAAYIYQDDQVNGYRAFVTNQLPSNLTKGTSTTICHSALFGVFSEVLVGLWGPGVELLVDPYSVAGQNCVAVHAFMMADVGLRHAAALCKVDDILVT